MYDELSDIPGLRHGSRGHHTVFYLKVDEDCHRGRIEQSSRDSSVSGDRLIRFECICAYRKFVYAAQRRCLLERRPETMLIQRSLCWKAFLSAWDGGCGEAD